MAPAVAQLLHEEGIAVRLPVLERIGAGGRVQLVAGGDVVLEQHRNAVQRPAHGARGPLGIQLRRNGERLGVEFHHRVELVDVVALDAVDVVGHQVNGGELPRVHQLLDGRECSCPARSSSDGCGLLGGPAVERGGKGREIERALGVVVGLGQRELAAAGHGHLGADLQPIDEGLAPRLALPPGRGQNPHPRWRRVRQARGAALPCSPAEQIGLAQFLIAQFGHGALLPGVGVAPVVRGAAVAVAGTVADVVDHHLPIRQRDGFDLDVTAQFHGWAGGGGVPDVEHRRQVGEAAAARGVEFQCGHRVGAVVAVEIAVHGEAGQQVHVETGRRWPRRCRYRRRWSA